MLTVTWTHLLQATKGSAYMQMMNSYWLQQHAWSAYLITARYNYKSKTYSGYTHAEGQHS